VRLAGHRGVGSRSAGYRGPKKTGICYKSPMPDSGDRGNLQASGFVTPLTSPHNPMAAEDDFAIDDATDRVGETEYPSRRSLAPAPTQHCCWVD
jgi:hypothetical protein